MAQVSFSLDARLVDFVTQRFAFSGLSLHEVNLSVSHVQPDTMPGCGKPLVVGHRILLEVPDEGVQVRGSTLTTPQQLRDQLLPMDGDAKFTKLKTIVPAVVVVLLQEHMGVKLDPRSFPSQHANDRLLYVVGVPYEVAVPHCFWTKQAPDNLGQGVGQTDHGDYYAPSVLALLTAIIIRLPSPGRQGQSEENSMVYGRFHHAKMGFFVRLLAERQVNQRSAQFSSACVVSELTADNVLFETYTVRNTVGYSILSIKEGMKLWHASLEPSDRDFFTGCVSAFQVSLTDAMGLPRDRLSNSDPAANRHAMSLKFNRDHAWRSFKMLYSESDAVLDLRETPILQALIVKETERKLWLCAGDLYSNDTTSGSYKPFDERLKSPYDQDFGKHGFIHLLTTTLFTSTKARGCPLLASAFTVAESDDAASASDAAPPSASKAKGPKKQRLNDEEKEPIVRAMLNETGDGMKLSSQSTGATVDAFTRSFKRLCEKTLVAFQTDEDDLPTTSFDNCKNFNMPELLAAIETNKEIVVALAPNLGYLGKSYVLCLAEPLYKVFDSLEKEPKVSLELKAQAKKTLQLLLEEARKNGKFPARIQPTQKPKAPAPVPAPANPAEPSEGLGEDDEYPDELTGFQTAIGGMTEADRKTLGLVHKLCSQIHAQVTTAAPAATAVVAKGGKAAAPAVVGGQLSPAGVTAVANAVSSTMKQQVMNPVVTRSMLPNDNERLKLLLDVLNPEKVKKLATSESVTAACQAAVNTALAAWKPPAPQAALPPPNKILSSEMTSVDLNVRKGILFALGNSAQIINMMTASEDTLKNPATTKAMLELLKQNLLNAIDQVIPEEEDQHKKTFFAMCNRGSSSQQ